MAPAVLRALPALLGFVFGTFIGSFLNVCIHRLPRNESIVSPPSRCYACGTRVAWYDNIPVLSYLLLLGRCRWCGTVFSPRYLAIELAVGLATAGVVFMAISPMGTVPSRPWWGSEWAWHLAPWFSEGAGAAVMLIVVYYVVVATVTDIQYMIIPDEITKSMQVVAPFLAIFCSVNQLIGWTPIVWFGARQQPDSAGFVTHVLLITLPVMLLLAFSPPVVRALYRRVLPPAMQWRDEDYRGFLLGMVWFLGSLVLPLIVMTVLVATAHSITPLLIALHLAQAVLGALTGWCALYIVGILGAIGFRREAMGFGDLKFLAPLGCLLGPIGVLESFFVATLVASVVGLPMRLLHARHEIPFGPYLAAGSLVMLIWGPFLHGYLVHLLVG